MKVLLGITGGIAAYKAAALLRLLKAEGVELRVMMTASAEAFVTPLTFQALSGHPVYTDTFLSQSPTAMDHIALARWADIIVIAPATADFIARLRQGRADDLLTTTCLASTAPVAIAPAMNQQMWQNSITQENIKALKARGILCYGPASGEQACGEVGPGRMLEPEDLQTFILSFFQKKLLQGKRILVTAGPTREAIDPIRYLSNRSTGKMGYAIAASAARLGAEVCLISGSSALETPAGVESIHVETAREMYDAVISRVSDYDVFISAAAVADYRAEAIAAEKIKKHSETLTLSLVKNPDILAAVTQLPHPPLTIGFAAETDHLIEHAKEKLRGKNVDMLVANLVGEKTGFGEVDTNIVLLNRQGEERIFPAMSKTQFAQQLMMILVDSSAESALLSPEKQ